jgi:hypothetical protein
MSAHATERDVYRRRVLVQSPELLNWLGQQSALSLKEYKR